MFLLPSLFRKIFQLLLSLKCLCLVFSHLFLFKLHGLIKRPIGCLWPEWSHIRLWFLSYRLISVCVYLHVIYFNHLLPIAAGYWLLNMIIVVDLGKAILIWVLYYIWIFMNVQIVLIMMWLILNALNVWTLIF